MTKIIWNQSGQKYYDYGINNAVLYVDGYSAVPWNGIISLSQANDQGDSYSLYNDGEKYLDYTEQQELILTLNTFEPPKVFNTCIGVKEINNGLFVSNQSLSKFNLAFKTYVYNDTNQNYNAYKFHLLYNAKVSLNDLEFITIDNNISNKSYSFNLSLLSTDPSFSAYQIIDSRDYSTTVMTNLENALYGTTNTSPYFPTFQGLSMILNGV